MSAAISSDTNKIDLNINESNMEKSNDLHNYLDDTKEDFRGNPVEVIVDT